MTPRFLAIDQYGDKTLLYTKHPRKELLKACYKKSCQKMFIDTSPGKYKHVGYVIGGLWLTLYKIQEWSKEGTRWSY